MRARLLMELQRASLLMYASCGWFFDDIAGLEASLVIRMAAHACDLMNEAGGHPPVRDVVEALSHGRSNRPQAGTGADVWRRVAGDRITPARAIGRAALGALAGGAPLDQSVPPVPGFDIEVLRGNMGAAPGGSTFSGRARALHRRTGREMEADFSALIRRGALLEVRVAGERLTLADLGSEARSSVIMAALPSLLDEASEPEVARLILRAARDLPPDRETLDGLARQGLLVRVLVALVAPARGRPTADSFQIAGELLDVVDLPPGSRQRRELEELVAAELEHGRPSAALRALATKMGFAPVVAVAAPEVDPATEAPQSAAS
jgi:hypothetical protein